MSERELPPSGPLGRLRAQLAGPRGYRQIDALLSSEDAAAAVAALSPNEVFELVHEVGFQDGQDLIELATVDQLRGCFDLDGWNKDQLEVASLMPWLNALAECGFEKTGEVWAGLDTELRALIIQRSVKIYDTTLEEGPADDNDEPMYTTPDGFFILELQGDDNTQRAIMRLVEDLYRSDILLARNSIMAARSEPPAELEEYGYRWRAGRLADLGYVDFYDALDLFRPLAADDVQIGEGSQDRAIGDDSSRLPLAIAEEVIGRSFLARAISRIEEPIEAERIERALSFLVNKVLAAGRAKPGQAEFVRRGALYATSTLSLGLETVARGDLVRAEQALRSIALGRLFRVGYTLGHKLAKVAQALAPRSLTAGTPARELVAALCSPRPLFAKIADQPPSSGVRPFESNADLRRTGEILSALTIRIALVESLGVDVAAMGRLPEPRPELDDHIRTALARAVIAGELRGEALSQRELTALRERGFAGVKLTSEARAAGRASIRARLGASQLAAAGSVLDPLLEGWLDDLERILGGIVGDVVDARFVDGVIVEVARS